MTFTGLLLVHAAQANMAFQIGSRSYFICVLLIDVVLDGDRTILREVFWGDLYQIGEGRLYRLVSFWLGSEKTLCKARERSNATDKNEHGESN